MRTGWPHLALTGALLAVAAGTTLSAQAPRTEAAAIPQFQAREQAEPPLLETQSEREERFRRPIIRIAQDYTVRADDIVRDVRTVFGDVTVEGRVEHDVVVILGSARLTRTAVVHGALVVIGGSATADEGAQVERDLVVVGGTLTAAPGFSPHGEHVVIGSRQMGDTLRDLLPWITRGLLWGRLIVPDLSWVWAIVAIFFLLYAALNTIFDRPVAASADVLIQRPLSAFITGLLVLLLTVPVLVIVAASVIGLAVVPFLLCGLIVTALVGKAAVARAIGRSIFRTESEEGRLPAFASFTLGFVVLGLAYMVPLLGAATWALTSVLGLGAATVTFRAYLRRERQAASPASGVAEELPISAAAPHQPVQASAAAAVETPREPMPPPDEPPPPADYSAGLARYPRATFLDRVAAFALDCILVAIANVLLDMHRNDASFFLLLLAYHIAFWAWRGTTLGGIICNLRVVRTEGTELRFVDAMVRGLSSVFSIVALGIGCFWMLQDPQRQMWHDKIAATLVVKVPRQLVLP